MVVRRFDHSVSHDGAPGDLAVVFDHDRKFAAIGLLDPDSPIRVKVLTPGSPRQIDGGLWRERLSVAADRRASLADDAGTTAYRLVHGENDGLPGLVVDRYAATLVVKIYIAGLVSASASRARRARRGVAARACGAPSRPVGRRRRDVRAGRRRRHRRTSGRRSDPIRRARPEDGSRCRPWPEDRALPRPARQPRARAGDGRGRRRPRRVRLTGGSRCRPPPVVPARCISSISPHRRSRPHATTSPTTARCGEVRALLGRTPRSAMRSRCSKTRARDARRTVRPRRASIRRRSRRNQGAVRAGAAPRTPAHPARRCAVTKPGGILVQASCSSRVTTDEFFGDGARRCSVGQAGDAARDPPHRPRHRPPDRLRAGRLPQSHLRPHLTNPRPANVV